MPHERTIYLNGRFLPESEARISVYDSALLFGDSVFEMTRSFNGETFKLDEHIVRLRHSMAALNIPDICLGEREWQHLCMDVIAENDHGPGEEHRLLIMVSRGPLGCYKEAVDHVGPTVCITDFPLRWTVVGFGRWYDGGVHAVVPFQRQIPSRLVDAKIKHRSRLHFACANQQVLQLNDPDAWALLVDEDGYLTEGTGANVVVVREGQLYTPAHNCLRGISLDTVREFEDVIDANLTPYDLMTADEAFFTGTPFCIMPITTFNGRPIGDGKVGDVTTSLLCDWSDDVDVDIVGQIHAWDAQRTEPVGSSVYVAR